MKEGTHKALAEIIGEELVFKIKTRSSTYTPETPVCKTMLEDAQKQKAQRENVEIRDVVEIVLSSVK